LKVGKTEIICIIDRSGSMNDIKQDAIGGFNVFLEEQKKLPSECVFTYTQFNQDYEIVHNGIPLADMKPLDETTFVPAGMTALLDAVGRTVDEVGIRLSATPEDEKPEQVILVILTDGEENSSQEYSWSRVAEMLKLQTEKYGWRVVFLAQNLDSQMTATNMGLNPDAANVYVSNMTKGGVGYRTAVRGASFAVSSARSSGTIDKVGTSVIVSGEEQSSPKPSRATGRGIGRAKADRLKNKKTRGGSDPNFN
jgi:hypothetical protein